jgi:hypothetical protein
MKVRFNLGAGKNFMHWNIDGVFYNPATTSMVLHNCKLRNRQATARKIFAGAHKEVCAWVQCERIEFGHNARAGAAVSYNPRIAPNWIVNGENADNKHFDKLITIGSKIFIAGV